MGSEQTNTEETSKQQYSTDRTYYNLYAAPEWISASSYQWYVKIWLDVGKSGRFTWIPLMKLIFSTESLKKPL